MSLFTKPKGVETRWFSFENRSSQPGVAGMENRGAKGHAFDQVLPGETLVLAECPGSGILTRIWLTVSDRSPEMLRSLRIDMFWDGAVVPAVSAPLGDFFGVAHGRRMPFENALFSDPEGRSFNCSIPMPFRRCAKVTITNESEKRLAHLFYDLDFLVNVNHEQDMLYFHAHWRREKPNKLGKEFAILPAIKGSGRFLGCNLGIATSPVYDGSWWGEGEVKVRFGSDVYPTLCGTGTEDYIGTGWGQGTYCHRYQGCLIADRPNRQFAFYRYHIEDPIYFDKGCSVTIQTIGGAGKADVIRIAEAGGRLIPVSIDTGLEAGFHKLLDLPQPVDLTSQDLPEGWCNFWREDDWCATAYFYLDNPGGQFEPIPPATERFADLVSVDAVERADA